MRFVYLILAFVLSVSPLAAPTKAVAKTLTIGIAQYPASLHPNITAMLAKSYVLGFVHRPMITFDQDWKPVCFLCVEVPSFENGLAEQVTLDDGSEGVQVTYHLRDDAFWGDGTPVTARDAEFTLALGKDPKAGFVSTESYDRILDFEILNDKAYRVTIDRVTYRYYVDGAFTLVPVHMDGEIAEDIEGYAANSLYQKEPTNPGLWTGPYRVSAVDPGRSVTVARNEAWKGPEPAFEQIVIKVVENTAALEANFLSGEVDMIAGELGLPIDQALSLERRLGDRGTIFYQSGLIYEHMEANLDNPVLADLMVRQAILHGLDRASINTRLFGGQQPAAETNINPLDAIHVQVNQTYPFDPEKAKALLSEAGWTPGPGGIRQNEAGEKLILTLMTTAGNQSRELVQQVIQAQLRDVGIDVRLQNEPPRVLFGETVRKRAFEDLVMFAWISAPENVPRTILRSDQIPTEENNWTGQNVAGYANPKMDALLDSIETELDREKRQALWVEYQNLYAETLPALPLFFRANPHVMPTWLEGLRPTGHLAPSTLWVEEWVDAR